MLFEEGTAPKLELLLYEPRITFSGLSSLQSLKEVMINSKYGFTLDLESVEDLGAQVSSNRNKPVVKIIN